jgi:hypothetical protein
LKALLFAHELLSEIAVTVAARDAQIARLQLSHHFRERAKLEPAPRYMRRLFLELCTRNHKGPPWLTHEGEIESRVLWASILNRKPVQAALPVGNQEFDGACHAPVGGRREQLDALQKTEEGGPLMGVIAGEKGKIVSPRSRLMRFTLLQNSISVRFDLFADGGQSLLRRTFGSIGQGHAVKYCDKIVGTFHMLGLVLQKSGAGLIVKPLHEPEIHVRNIVQRPARLRKYEGRGKGEALRLRQIVHRCGV